MEKNGKHERQRQRREEEKVAAIVPCEGSTTNKNQTKERRREHVRARIAHHERLVESVEHLSFSFSLSLSDEFLLSGRGKRIQKCCLGFQSHTNRAHALFGKEKRS